jgi:hypothetical protein
LQLTSELLCSVPPKFLKQTCRKGRISSLQNMVEATFRSKYVHFFVVLKEASRFFLSVLQSYDKVTVASPYHAVSVHLWDCCSIPSLLGWSFLFHLYYNGPIKITQGHHNFLGIHTFSCRIVFFFVKKGKLTTVILTTWNQPWPINGEYVSV